MAEDTVQPITADIEGARQGQKEEVFKRKKWARTLATALLGVARRSDSPSIPSSNVCESRRLFWRTTPGRNVRTVRSVTFAGIGWSGQVGVEISSAIKYGLFQRPSPGKGRTDRHHSVELSDLRNLTDKVDAIREALLKAPLISADIYKQSSR